MAEQAKPKKNYIKGSAKQHQFDNGGSVLHIDLLVSDLDKIKNEKGYAKITVSENRTPDTYGNTHSIYQNDWKPKEGVKAPVAKMPVKAKAKDTFPEIDTDLPF